MTVLQVIRPAAIGVAVIGAGRAGMIHARHISSGAIPGAELAAVADPNTEGLQAAIDETGAPRAYSDWMDCMIDDAVHAVIIATPTSLHRDVAVAAAAHGKHLFCEKPMAMDAKQCDDMVAAAEAAGVLLQIGFMRRFDAGFMAAKDRIDAGEIGEVVQVKSLTHGPATPQAWMYDLQKSNGPLAEVSSHDIDTLRWFTGSEFTEVYAVGGNYRSPQARDDFPDFYDNVTLIARFANGKSYPGRSLRIRGRHSRVVCDGMVAQKEGACHRRRQGVGHRCPAANWKMHLGQTPSVNG